VNFTPTIVFRCTKNTSTVSVSADLGAHNSSGQRRLALGAAAGGPFLNYQLYQPDTGAPGTCSAYSTVYVPTTAEYAVGSAAFATSQTDVTVNLCGQIAANQDAAVGTYNDLVNVVVNY